MKFKNKTNSPYRLIAADGKFVILPARGEIDIDPHPQYVEQYKALGYFEITDSPAKKPEKPSKDPSAERAQAQKDGKDGGGKK